ncbi:MAG: hypothetical protein JSV00_07770, partial [bacterium]
FIDPDGRVAEKVRDEGGRDLFVEGILVREVPLSGEITYYTRYGDVFAWVMMGISGVFLITAGTVAVRGRSRPEP